MSLLTFMMSFLTGEATKPRYHGNDFLIPGLSMPDYGTYPFHRIRTYPDSIGRKERAVPLERDEKEVTT